MILIMRTIKAGRKPANGQIGGGSRKLPKQIFTRSFTEMTDADWAVCPRTINAVESQNKRVNKYNQIIIVFFYKTLYNEIFIFYSGVFKNQILS